MMVKTKKIGAILARVVLIGSAVAAAYEKSIDAAACEKSNQAKNMRVAGNPMEHYHH